MKEITGSMFSSPMLEAQMFANFDRMLQSNISVDAEAVCNENFDEDACLQAIDEVVALVVSELFEDEEEGVQVIAKASSDAIWLILAGTLVFFMHAGFSMLEAGSVRRPNVVNIMFKNLGTVVIGAIVYWAVGFAFAYGSNGNGFIGGSNFFFDFNDEDDANEAFFFFQYTFAVTAATIISGAVAERIQLTAYWIVALITTGFVFPVVTHWVWSESGFMSAFKDVGNNADKLVSGSIGLIDFAGSGVVHATGGTIAFVGAYLIGPRTGRFVGKETIRFGIASYTLQTLGVFILWFGWFGFNPGSTLVFDGVNTAKAALTTVVAPSAAGVVGVLYPKLVRGYYDLPTLLNCVLSGLVAITAGCVAVFDNSAIFIGLIAGFLYIGGANLLIKLRVDDPLGASVVHGLCGAWGVIAVGIFTDNDAIADAYGVIPDSQGEQFAMQLTGIIIILLWATLWGFIIFVPLKLLRVLRVTEDVEKIGLDESEMGGELVVHF